MLRIAFLLSVSLLSVALLSTAHPAQAEIYKTVDAQGRVAYTNKAPVGAEQQIGTGQQVGTGQTVGAGQKKIEQVEIREGYSNKLNITQTGSVSYCGSIALPSHEIGRTNFYGTVANSERTWKAEIARIEKQFSEYQRHGKAKITNYNNANLTRLAENQCAYDWAQGLRKQARSEKLALDRKSEGLNRYLQEMLAAQASVCGEEPVYVSSDRFFDDRRKTWRRCTADYQSKMRGVQTDLKKTDQQLLDIHKIEIGEL